MSSSLCSSRIGFSARDLQALAGLNSEKSQTKLGLSPLELNPVQVNNLVEPSLPQLLPHIEIQTQYAKSQEIMAAAVEQALAECQARFLT